MVNLLFVDDDTLTLQLMQRIAGFLGYKAMTCASPIKGLDMVVESRPDLVLVDMQMEDMSGLRFVEEIRKRSEVRFTPVLILSAGESMQDEERAKKAGADGYLNKPLSLENLENAVKQYVKKSSG